MGYWNGRRACWLIAALLLRVLLLCVPADREADPPVLDEATAERVMAALYKPDALQATLLTAWRCNCQHDDRKLVKRLLLALPPEPWVAPGPAPGPATQPEQAPEHETGPETETELGPESEPEAETEQEQGPETETELGPESEPEAETEQEQEPETETELGPETEAETEPEAEAQSSEAEVE